MQIKQIFYWLLCLVLILFTSCATSKAQNNESTEAPQKLLLFQKTPCYGTCPAYNATFYSDGSLIYEGFRYVPVQDTVKLQLTQEQLQKVQTSIQELNYTSLENSYLSNYTDLPSSYLTFYENDKEVKRVKHQQAGPQELQQTIKELHEMVMQLLTER